MNLDFFRKVDVVQAEDGKSLYMDFDLQTHLARLTVWRWEADSGACDLEVLNIESEETELWEHREFQHALDFYAILADYNNRLDALAQKQAAAAPQQRQPPFELLLDGKAIGLGAILEPLLVSGKA